MLKRILRLNVVLAVLGGLALTIPSVLGAADSTTLQQVINEGSLTVDTPAGTVSLAAVSYSHTGQNNTNNALGNIAIEDARGSGAGWTADWTGANWDGGGAGTMAYNGNGTTTGQLCIQNPVVGNITVNGGTDDKADWTYGANDCFDGATTTINMITTGASKGDGNYTVGNVQVDQFIPAQQAPGTYTMSLTLTVS